MDYSQVFFMHKLIIDLGLLTKSYESKSGILCFERILSSFHLLLFLKFKS